MFFILSLSLSSVFPLSINQRLTWVNLKVAYGGTAMIVFREYTDGVALATEWREKLIKTIIPKSRGGHWSLSFTPSELLASIVISHTHRA